MDDPIVTEKATTRWDLPHGYFPLSTADAECACHRAELDPIHSTSLPAERASAATGYLTTEKGT